MTKLNLLLDKCLLNKSPVKALLVASLGCFLGSFLVIFATDIYFESKKLEQPDEGIFITLNKKVEGGLLENFIQQEKVFFLMNSIKSPNCRELLILAHLIVIISLSR